MSHTWWESPEGGDEELRQMRDELITAVDEQDWTRAEEIVSDLEDRMGDERSRVGEMFADIYDHLRAEQDLGRDEATDATRRLFGYRVA